MRLPSKRRRRTNESTTCSTRWKVNTVTMSHNEPDSPATNYYLIVDRYKTMDAVNINFMVPAGTFTGARATQVADEVRAFIAAHDFDRAALKEHHPGTGTHG